MADEASEIIEDLVLQFGIIGTNNQPPCLRPVARKWTE